jgi:mannosidase alpha-like ER degradation enhancer 1
MSLSSHVKIYEKNLIWSFLFLLTNRTLSFSDQYTDAYSHFPEDLRLKLLNETREMFTFGYDSYMKYAFPLDELDPIHCTGKFLSWKMFKSMLILIENR